MTGNVTRSHQIAAFPAVVQTSDESVHAFLTGLPAPNFETVADTKTLWAVVATNAGEGSIFAGSAFVVSAEAHKRVKARRY